MSIQVSTWQRSAERQMGSVFASITIRNRGDEALFERGHIGEDGIRSVTLDQFLVATGATTLCFSASTIAALGLVLLKTVPFRTATGDRYGRLSGCEADHRGTRRQL